MRSKGGNVLGPSKAVYAGPIPRVSGGSGNDGLTVMYSANAEGTLMPPFLVHPEQRPITYDPLTGATRGTSVENSTKVKHIPNIHRALWRACWRGQTCNTSNRPRQLPYRHGCIYHGKREGDRDVQASPKCHQVDAASGQGSAWPVEKGME